MIIVNDWSFVMTVTRHVDDINTTVDLIICSNDLWSDKIYYVILLLKCL